MGMFDTVIIEGLKLPKLPRNIENYLEKNNSSTPNEFQTKDLDNILTTYFIDSKGQIFVEEYRLTGKKIPYDPPFKGWKDNRSFLERLYFKIKEKNLDRKYPQLKTVDERKTVRVKSNLTNTFLIYTIDEINNRYLELELSVLSIKGKVKDIKVVKAFLEKEKDAKKRKLQNLEFDKKFAKSIENRNNFRSKWYYPLLKEIYNPLVFFSSKIIQSLCNYILKNSYRWHGI